MGVDLRDVTAADFSKHAGTAFRLVEAGIDLTLAEVREVAGAARPGGGFVLTFEGPAGLHLPQAIHELAHPAMGEAGIFLVPIQPRPGASLYEAVFS